MIIGIKKLENGLLFMDKCRYNIVFPRNKMGSTNRVYTDEELSQSPYNYTKVEIDDVYSDCQESDFNDDLTFSIEKYNARKEQENKLNYKKEVERLVALRYDIYDELAIQRQKEEKPEEYKEYYNYVEQCKLQAKELCNIDKEVKDVYTE